jgi:hypothetical protein
LSVLCGLPVVHRLSNGGGASSNDVGGGESSYISKVSVTALPSAGDWRLWPLKEPTNVSLVHQLSHAAGSHDSLDVSAPALPAALRCHKSVPSQQKPIV